jgi:hypothetical protein
VAVADHGLLELGVLHADVADHLANEGVVTEFEHDAGDRVGLARGIIEELLLPVVGVGVREGVCVLADNHVAHVQVITRDVGLQKDVDKPLWKLHGRNRQRDGVVAGRDECLGHCSVVLRRVCVVYESMMIKMLFRFFL